MTTAARPTFDPAKGKDSSNPTAQTHSRDLASHTKLKYRKDGQDEHKDLDPEDFKNRLLAAEREHLIKAGKLDPEAKPMTPEQQALLEHVEKGGDLSLKEEEEEEEAEEEGEYEDLDDEEIEARLAKINAELAEDSEVDENEEDEEDDDEEETALLMKELAKIKQERAEAQLKIEREKEENEKRKEEEILRANPLLNLTGDQDFTVKRRWDDDVIFKNQSQGEDDKPNKRFINDMLRSDFHRKFMDKYIR